MESIDWNETKQWIRRWIDYVGLGRLVAGVVVVAISACGAWLLVRPSGVAVEAMLPMASTGDMVSRTTVNPLPTTVMVHVAGAVRNPGVYRLPASARVVDAVVMAGGATSRADLESINLAQTIVDTEQVYVPVRRASRPPTTVAPRLRPRRNLGSSPTTVASSQSTPSTGTAVSTARVNINTATASQLDALPGVGPTTARAIIAYRTKNGPYSKVEDLLNVSGIGPSKLSAMRDRVTV